jgi:ADP-heptose:LPS heptosyltransferase
MCAATGAPRKIGFANAREGAVHFYTDRIAVPDASRIHAVDRYWRVAEALGAGGRPKRFIVPLQPAELATVDRELVPFPRPWLAFGVGSRWVTKCWPPAHFADLANRAQTAFGGTVLFVGTADDTAASLAVARGLRGPSRDLTGKTSLPRLAAVLARADAVVANDTGPLHLAAALGRPCVAPYTCTKAVLHGPYGAAGGGVETTVACGGSYLKRCPRGMVCMADLTPDKLWEPLAGVLSAWADRCRSA